MFAFHSAIRFMSQDVEDSTCAFFVIALLTVLLCISSYLHLMSLPASKHLNDASIEGPQLVWGWVIETWLNMLNRLKPYDFPWGHEHPSTIVYKVFWCENIPHRDHYFGVPGHSMFPFDQFDHSD